MNPQYRYKYIIKWAAHARHARIGVLFFILMGGVITMNVAHLHAAVEKTYPVVVGVDNAGDFFRTIKEYFWCHEAYFDALEELGATYYVMHLFPHTVPGATNNSERTATMIQEFDAAMRAHGLTYVLNNEHANFVESAEITPGINEYAHPDGTHRWDLRMEWLTPLQPPAQPNPAFQGVMYDECGHMLLSNNKFANRTRTFDAPFLVDTHGMDLEKAYEKLVAAMIRLRTDHYEGKVPLLTEDVWPDLFHLFARAGWTLTPKFLKEGFSPVVASVALGAALQYADRTHFNVTPDLWGLSRYPGHSLEALRSALLMGYWLGAERIHVENMDFAGTKVRHSDATTTGSLVRWLDADHYELTPYGAVVRDFAKQYVPAHPRPITWRDYKPRVAIVRFPDGGWGQYGDDIKTGCPSRNRLLGNREHPMDAEAAEWLQVWSILTHGVTRPGAISYYNKVVYPEGIHDFFAEGTHEFFVPVDSVAVFDHLVTGPVLDSVECFVVCGRALTAESFKAIAARAAKGAVCIIARRLYDKHNPDANDLPGDWLVVDDFRDPAVAAKLHPFLGPADVARYRFAGHTVDFKKGAKADRLEVQIIKGSPNAAVEVSGGGMTSPRSRSDVPDRHAPGIFRHH